MENSKRRITFNVVGWLLCIIVGVTLIILNLKSNSAEVEQLKQELEETKEEVLMNSVFIDHTREKTYEMITTLSSLMSVKLMDKEPLYSKVIDKTMERLGIECMPEFDQKEIKIKSLDNIRYAIDKLKEDAKN